MFPNHLHILQLLHMVSVAMFVIIMDILKYCFGIDPVREERSEFDERNK